MHLPQKHGCTLQVALLLCKTAPHRQPPDSFLNLQQCLHLRIATEVSKTASPTCHPLQVLSILRLRKPPWLRFSCHICISLFYRSGFQIKETDFQRQTLFWQPFLAKCQNNPVSWPASGSSIFTNQQLWHSLNDPKYLPILPLSIQQLGKKMQRNQITIPTEPELSDLTT